MQTAKIQNDCRYAVKSGFLLFVWQNLVTTEYGGKQRPYSDCNNAQVDQGAYSVSVMRTGYSWKQHCQINFASLLKRSAL